MPTDTFITVLTARYITEVIDRDVDICSNERVTGVESRLNWGYRVIVNNLTDVTSRAIDLLWPQLTQRDRTTQIPRFIPDIVGLLNEQLQQADYFMHIVNHFDNLHK